MTEGLRERKKRETRQHISDIATGLFLERGFEEVRVSDVAAAAGVSEKTVYNYFTTKESLLLDREEPIAEALREALGPGAPDASPIDAVLRVLLDGVREFYGMWEDNDDGFRSILRFREMVEGTASLRAAQRDMMDRTSQVAAEAMAQRAGVDPQSPEPQIAATALMGLFGVQFRAMHRQAEIAPDAQSAERAVVSDVRRAARLLDTGLWSFAMVVQGTHGREQLRQAALASDEARKQVIAAMRQARSAWRAVAAEGRRH